jgi:hypothetical protein
MPLPRITDRDTADVIAEALKQQAERENSMLRGLLQTSPGTPEKPQDPLEELDVPFDRY